MSRHTYTAVEEHTKRDGSRSCYSCPSPCTNFAHALWWAEPKQSTAKAAWEDALKLAARWERIETPAVGKHFHADYPDPHSPISVRQIDIISNRTGYKHARIWVERDFDEPVKNA